MKRIIHLLLVVFCCLTLVMVVTSCKKARLGIKFGGSGNDLSNSLQDSQAVEDPNTNTYLNCSLKEELKILICIDPKTEDPISYPISQIIKPCAKTEDLGHLVLVLENTDVLLWIVGKDPQDLLPLKVPGSLDVIFGEKCHCPIDINDALDVISPEEVVCQNDNDPQDPQEDWVCPKDLVCPIKIDLKNNPFESFNLEDTLKINILEYLGSPAHTCPENQYRVAVPFYSSHALPYLKYMPGGSGVLPNENTTIYFGVSGKGTFDLMVHQDRGILKKGAKRHDWLLFTCTPKLPIQTVIDQGIFSTFKQNIGIHALAGKYHVYHRPLNGEKVVQSHFEFIGDWKVPKPDPKPNPKPIPTIDKIKGNIIEKKVNVGAYCKGLPKNYTETHKKIKLAAGLKYLNPITCLYVNEDYWAKANMHFYYKTHFYKPHEDPLKVKPFSFFVKDTDCGPKYVDEEGGAGCGGGGDVEVKEYGPPCCFVKK